MRKTRSQTQAENASLNNQRNGINQQITVENPPEPVPAPSYSKAEYLEVHNMILFFRVYELQRLLLQLNGQHGGRKIDLQNRLIELLKKNFRQVSQLVRDLYKICSTENRDSPTEFNPPSEKRMYQPQMQLTCHADVRNVMGSNIVLPFANMSQGYPINPDVRLKKLAFYDELATLLKPSTLIPTSNQRPQESTFHFTLTPQQASDIATNRDIRNCTKIEHVVQVQLRFCLLETSCEQEDCFPPNVIVKVNNKVCPLPNIIPSNRPNVEPKRPPRPVNVTANVKISPTVSNTILVSWCPDFTRGYVLSAFLVRKLTSAELLHRMKTKGIKAADYTRALIKEKLNEDADCEIATTMLKVSLICPLGKMRMTIPCRASTCSHLQCFDASLFLQMNERKPTWYCPVCDKPALYENLVIDGYFQEVLVSSLLTSSDTEIQLHKDGSWSTQRASRSDPQILDTPNKAIEQVEVICDDLEVLTTQPVTKSAATEVMMNDSENKVPLKLPIPDTAPANNEPTTTTTNETVDLTLSDSDDDLPLRRKTSQPNKIGNPMKNSLNTQNIVNNNQSDSDFEIFTNQTGGKVLVHKNFTFYKNVTDHETVFWRCARNLQGRCFVKCVTVGSQLVKVTGVHNHSPDMEALRILHAAKEKPTQRTPNSEDNLLSSIISLDSPSPPASPNTPNANENGTANSSNNSNSSSHDGCVSSTTVMNYSPLPRDMLDASTMPNYQINPMAINRYKNLRKLPSRKNRDDPVMISKNYQTLNRDKNRSADGGVNRVGKGSGISDNGNNSNTAIINKTVSSVSVEADSSRANADERQSKRPKTDRSPQYNYGP